MSPFMYCMPPSQPCDASSLLRAATLVMLELAGDPVSGEAGCPSLRTDLKEMASGARRELKDRPRRTLACDTPDHPAAFSACAKDEGTTRLSQSTPRSLYESRRLRWSSAGASSSGVVRDWPGEDLRGLACFSIAISEGEADGGVHSLDLPSTGHSLPSTCHSQYQAFHGTSVSTPHTTTEHHTLPSAKGATQHHTQTDGMSRKSQLNTLIQSPRCRRGSRDLLCLLSTSSQLQGFELCPLGRPRMLTPHPYAPLHTPMLHGASYATPQTHQVVLTH
ncbi:hypothetical protein E2C01_052466 [Portunus trituberculatus]|uniref:Uncharacterized protein n=1 Tax=Portunus trituberculatus TaxID=210409 RepID=A0A5B7GDT0_PORTR|nr:hypothetical protein [Portunus trituberculatus]